MGKDLKNKINRTIIIKGNATKFYDEVIFVMKEKNPDLFLADKIFNKYDAKKIIRIKLILECVFYVCLLIFVLILLDTVYTKKDEKEKQTIR